MQENPNEIPITPLESNNSLFWLHLKLLLWKNFKLFTRSIKLTIFQLATPVFFCLLIVYLQWLADSFTTLSLDNPTIKVGPMRKCMGDGCFTIGFGIIVFLMIMKNAKGNETNLNSSKYEWVNHAIKYVADDNDLSLEYDIKLLSIGETKDFYNYVLTHQNQTLYGILFCTTEYFDIFYQ